jgi:hypothetical protein
VCFAGFEGEDCSKKVAVAKAKPAAESAAVCSRSCTEVCIDHATHSDIDKCHISCHDCCLAKLEANIPAKTAASECVEGIKAGVMDKISQTTTQ